MPERDGRAQGWDGALNKKRPPGEGGRKSRLGFGARAAEEREPVMAERRLSAGRPDGWGDPDESDASGCV
jgi:hypothetical protein